MRAKSTAVPGVGAASLPLVLAGVGAAGAGAEAVRDEDGSLEEGVPPRTTSSASS